MYRSRAFSPLVAALVTALAWFLVSVAGGRSFGAKEVAIVALASFVIVAAWRARRLRRERMQAEELRDSALW
jgi:Flp pilus assembly protein TadB